VMVTELAAMIANNPGIQLRGAATLWDKNTAGRVKVNMSKDGVALWDSKTGISHRMKPIEPVDLALLSTMLRNLQESCTTSHEGSPAIKQEESEIEYAMGPTSAVPNLRGLKFDDAVDAVVDWFFTNFEDPVESTPYESAEGGYIYIWGGPCDAGEEIYDAFGDAISEAVVEAAVERIELDGYEWAPHEHRMRAVA
jgi:hypothetical protein